MACRQTDHLSLIQESCGGQNLCLQLFFGFHMQSVTLTLPQYIYVTLRKAKLTIWRMWPYMLSIFHIYNLKLPVFVLCSHSVIQFFWRVFFPLHSCIATQCLNVMDKLPCCYFPFHLKMQMAEWKLYQACQRQENNWLISLWPSEDWFRGNAIISH